MRRGEVRWYNFPQLNKRRPVVILTRDSTLEFLGEVMVAPITSTIREIPTEVALDEADGMRRPCAVNLDHVVTIPKPALGRRVTGLSPERMLEVCRALAFALGCG